MSHVVVVGGANMDLKATSSSSIVAGTSNPGSTAMSPGGVGRNIAENLARLGTPVRLVSVVGEDPMGSEVLDRTAAAGVDVSAVRRQAVATGSYTAVLDADGELVVAIADMGAADTITPDLVAESAVVFAGAALVVLDGNLRVDTAHEVVRLAHHAGARVVFEPVSVPKAARLAGAIAGIWMATPNCDELAALAGIPSGQVSTTEEILAACAVLHGRGIEVVWVRRGLAGSLVSTPTGVDHLPAYPTDVVDVTGAGDSMLAGFCHAVAAADGEPDLVEAARLGHAAAALTVASPLTVRPDLTMTLIKEMMDR